MRAKKIIRRIAIIAAVIAALIAAAMTLLPWKVWVQQKLIATLEQQGLSPVQLTVDGIGVHGITLKNVSFGEPAISLNNLTLGYSLHDLVQQKMDSKLQLRSEQLSLNAGGTPVTIGIAEVTLMPEGSLKQWHGTWKLTDVVLEQETLALPKLQGNGDITVSEKTLALNGGFTSANKAHQAMFSLDYALTTEAASQLVVTNAHMPWSDGVLAVKQVKLPLGSKKPITLTLDVDKVPIANLLQLLTGDKVTATGMVSGAVPLTILSDGQVRVGKGSLGAEQPGMIALAPETIPGDNPQVALVREIMKNLHYSMLALELDMAPDNTLSALLAIEGKNPDVENGRPIKLKVHLSGDLLNLLEQNITLMNDPTTFIEQHHETTP